MRKRKADKGSRDNFLMNETDRQLANEFSGAREDDGAATNQIQLRIFTQAGNLPGQPFRKTDVIGIHPGDELALAESDRLIEARRKSGGSGFADEPEHPSRETLPRWRHSDRRSRGVAPITTINPNRA